MNPTRVAVFEQMPLVRAGVVQVLEEQFLEVVAESDTLDDTAGVVPFADVIVVDADLLAPDSMVRVLRSLCGKTKVVLLTLTADEERARAAFSAGVRGCVLKGGGRHELVDAVRAAHRDETYVAPSIAALLMRNLATARGGTAAKSVSGLSFRESQIFDLLSNGLKNKEIGAHLSLSEKSVKRYVTCIFEKLNVRNRVEAAMLSKARKLRPPATEIPAVTISGKTALASPALLSPNGNGLLATTRGSETGTLTSERKPAGPSALGSTARYFHAVFGRTRFAPEASSDDVPAGSTPAGKHIVL